MPSFKELVDTEGYNNQNEKALIEKEKR